MKIRTKGRQEFNVPNTPEGKEFTRLAKKFLNRNHYGYRRRGRGSRPNAAAAHSLSPEHENCEWVALYLQNRPRPLPAPALPPASKVEEDIEDLSPMELQVLDIALDLTFWGNEHAFESLADVMRISTEESVELVKRINKKLR